MVSVCESWVRSYAEYANPNKTMFSASPEEYIKQNSGRRIIYNPHLNDYDFYYVWYTIESTHCVKYCFERLVETVVTQPCGIPRLGPCKCSSDDDTTFTIGDFVIQLIDGFQGSEEIRYGIYLPVKCGAWGAVYHEQKYTSR